MQNTSTVLERNTPAWRFQAWAVFIISLGMTLIGTFYLNVDFWAKGYIIMGILFTVGSAFSLSKTVRDDLESQKLANRVQGAKTEKMLKEFE